MLKKVSRKAQASTVWIPHPLVDARRGGGQTRMTKQVKKDDDMEVETKKVGKNGPEIVKNIYNCHLKEQNVESFPCDVCGKTSKTKGGLTHG